MIKNNNDNSKKINTEILIYLLPSLLQYTNSSSADQSVMFWFKIIIITKNHYNRLLWKRTRPSVQVSHAARNALSTVT